MTPGGGAGNGSISPPPGFQGDDKGPQGGTTISLPSHLYPSLTKSTAVGGATSTAVSWSSSLLTPSRLEGQSLSIAIAGHTPSLGQTPAPGQTQYPLTAGQITTTGQPPGGEIIHTTMRSL